MHAWRVHGVILMHCAAISCDIKKRAIFSQRDVESREIGEIGSVRSVQQMFVPRMLLDFRARRHTRTSLLSRGENKAPFSLSLSRLVHAGSTFLLSHEEPD